MLSYDMKDGEYYITETTHSFSDTKIKVVVYSSDLMNVRCDGEPMRPTTQSARDWFEKYYRPKFAIMEDN